MGQQLKAREKRRRRKAYIARKRLAAIESRPAPVRKKAVPKKAPAAAAAH
jgi:hypothetical protein